MQRALALLFALFFACPMSRAATPDTVNPLPSPGSTASFNTRLLNFLTNEDADRYNEMFDGFVASGCLGATAAGLSHTPTSCTAYPAGFRTTETGAITYSNNATCWTIANAATTGNLTSDVTFTRVSGTHYLTNCSTSTQPTLPTGAVWLMKVVTSGGAITAVTDLRRLHVITTVDGTVLDTSGASGGQVINIAGYPFNAQCDGTTDDYNAIRAAIDVIPTTLDDGTNTPGATIQVPFGKCILTDTLVIDRSIRLTGVGAPQLTIGPSTLEWTNADEDGIVVAPGTVSSSGFTGARSIIENLFLSQAGSDSSGSGLWLRAQAVTVRNVVARGWGEYGFKIVASTSASPATNANLWYCEKCEAYQNGSHGFFVDGIDANAGNCMGCNSISNGGWGFYDSSFLGNTYVGCHSSTNTSGGYKTDDLNANSVFVGCYTEGDEPASELATQSLVLGGTYGIAPTGTHFRLDVNATGADVNRPIVQTNTAGPVGVTNQFGSTAAGVASTTVIEGSASTSGYQWAWDNTNRMFSLRENGSDSRVIFRLTNDLTTQAFGRADGSEPGPGYAVITRGVFLGSEGTGGGASVARWVGNAAGAPTGPHAIGDMTINRSVTAGGVASYHTTVAGTPGTLVGVPALVRAATAPITCTSTKGGAMFIDSDIEKVCICDAATPVYFRADTGATGTTTSCG